MAFGPLIKATRRNKILRELKITIKEAKNIDKFLHLQIKLSAFFVNVMVDDPNKRIFRKPNNTTPQRDRRITSSSQPCGKRWCTSILYRNENVAFQNTRLIPTGTTPRDTFQKKIPAEQKRTLVRQQRALP